LSEISRVWVPLRDHLSIYGQLTRIESPIEAGVADVDYTLLGCSGWIENKLFEANEDRRPRHLTRYQIEWGEAKVRAGGRWFLFGRSIAAWLLYDVRGARRLLEGGGSSPLLKTSGEFPTRPLLEILAPISERRRSERT
jgi:hypothetical protein